MTEHPPTPRRGDDTNTTPDVDRVDPVGLIDCARHAEDALRQLARLTYPGPRAPGLTPAEVDTVLSHLAEAIAAVPKSPHSSAPSSTSRVTRTYSAWTT